MENLGSLILCYLLAYSLTTVVGVLHTLYNIVVLKMKPMDDKSMGEGYEKTKPYHPLYNLFLFPPFAFLYLDGLEAATLEQALWTSVIWGTTTLVVDVVGWVLIKHPWSLSFKAFFVDYQPWITLIYLIIYLSPLVAYGLM